MAGPVIAQSFAYVYWVLLVGLGVGAFCLVALTGRFSDATRGYLGFTAFIAALVVALGLAADLALPAAPELVIRPAEPILDALRRAALGLFVASATAYALLGREARARLTSLLAGLALIGGLGALAAAAFGWAPTFVDGVPLLIQLVLLTLASGGALAALVLGHWYLVTPRVSERPLLLQTRLLTVVLGLQVAVSLTWALFGGGPGQAAFEALTGGAALYGWLRIVVSLAFPLVLVAMANLTARSRSMESATGLLYIALAAVLAGTIGASALYFVDGLLV